MVHRLVEPDFTWTAPIGVPPVGEVTVAVNVSVCSLLTGTEDGDNVRRVVVGCGARTVSVCGVDVDARKSWLPEYWADS
jgi:hypothetical protein